MSIPCLLDRAGEGEGASGLLPTVMPLRDFACQGARPD